MFCENCNTDCEETIHTVYFNSVTFKIIRYTCPKCKDYLLKVQYLFMEAI